MSNEKPVELTEAEREALIDAIQDGTQDAFMARIKAAARREALLEAADAYSDWEVFLDTDGINSIRAHGLEPDAWLRRYSERYTEPERDEELEEIHHCAGCGEDYNILAESHIGHQPERDEESGR